MIDWPLDSNFIRRGSERNTFGKVRQNADGSPRPHQGWDFHAPPGTPCFAVADGTVAGVANSGAYGLVVVIAFQHTAGQRYYAAYCHLSKALVAKGDKVRLGQKIALTGRSGNAGTMRGEDDHLHFELRTVAFPGRGLDGRETPLNIFGRCPLKGPVMRKAKGTP